MTKPCKTIAVALSGGVDSSVAALMLINAGYNVFGVTMSVGSCSADLEREAALAAKHLGITHCILDVSERFSKDVVGYFVDEYLSGRTPNPCVVCNPIIKFGALSEFAAEKGADFFATGHYASVVTLPNGRLTLKTSEAAGKDQTYMLYGLSQKQLSMIMTPLGAYNKDYVRRVAEESALPSAKLPDSQEICFIPDNDLRRFISEKAGEKICPGKFLDLDGRVIGRHEGAAFYTVGQRKGLGTAFGKPMYVKEINTARNEITLCGNDELFSRGLTANCVNFMGIEDITDKIRVKAKIRSAHKPVDCTAHMSDGALSVVFDVPQRAVTPGQAVVLYDGGLVMCGGIIEKCDTHGNQFSSS